MVPILSLLLVLSLSIVVTRIATIALIHTGLSREAARFQARSAFTGAGFTTSESEGVVQHPVRRRIVMLLMLLGNAGIVTAVSSLILTFVNQDRAEATETSSIWWKIALLAGGVSILWLFATSTWIDRRLSNLIEGLMGRYPSLEARDFSNLMHLAGDYRLAELSVPEGHWLMGKSLGEAELRHEGIVVLGVTREDGTYLGTPDGETEIHAGDTLLTYARTTALEGMEDREPGSGGDAAHGEAVDQQDEVKQEEREAEDE